MAKLRRTVAVFHLKWKLAGTFDALFSYKDQLVIVDWKTNKKFDTSSDYNKKLLFPFETEDECKLFKDMPSRYYTNNAVERCKVRKLINDHHEFIGNLKPNADIGFTEDGLVRVGADIGGDPFRNIS
mgnify:CR=1 FL=1